MPNTSGPNYPEQNPARRPVYRQELPAGSAQHVLYASEVNPYPFGLKPYLFDRYRRREYYRAVLTPLVIGTYLGLKALAFTYTGDVTLNLGVQASVSNVLAAQRPLRHARAYIHSPWAPYERMAELTTAFNMDRSYVRMDSGTGALHLASNDPQINSDILNYGNLLVIESDYISPWVGTILTVQESLQSPSLEITAKDLANIIDNRVTAQSEKYTSTTGSTLVFNNLIDHMNLQGHTGIYRVSNSAAPSIQELQVGGQSVMQALNELHSRTDYEWWIDYTVKPTGIMAYINWGYRQGNDFSGECHLYAGQHFTDVDYKLDLTQAKAQLITIGDFGAELGDRTSAARFGTTTPNKSDLGVGSVERATELAARTISDLPAGLRSQRIRYDLMTGSQAELTRRAKRELERPLAATESFTLIVNRLADWRYFGVGNFITIHSHPGTADLVRRVRIVGMQPDEEKGEIEMVCEVPVN